MIEIAKKIIEEKRKREIEEKLFFRAYFYYTEGNYKKAIKLFNKIDNSESLYMKTIIHLKKDNFHECITHLHEYEDAVKDWPNFEEKEHALDKIRRLKERIRDKFL